MTRTIKIFDTTLRDGEQSPGCSMNLTEKVEMARQLEKLGVDVIEAGFPASSTEDFLAVKQISKHIKSATIAALARALPEDIEAANEALEAANHPRIHIFIATSDIHMKHKLKKTPEEILETATKMVKYAKTFCDDIEFSAEDASRSNPEFLYKIFENVIEAGATVINIPDTVGYAAPEEFEKLIVGIKKNVPSIHKVQISVHCHNDLGLAAANSLAAIKAGVDQIECTVNGIGERAGNAALEEIVMNLHTREDVYDVRCNVKTQEIYKTSKLLSTITGVRVQPNKAIVGENAFAHESSIHQKGILANQLTYQIIAPEVIGLTANKMILGKHSGKDAFTKRLKELGYELEEKAINRVFEDFRRLADKKKSVTDRDISAMVLRKRVQIPEVYKLDRFVINSGNTITTTAFVRLLCKTGAVIEEVRSSYDGPIDAAYKAIDKLVGHKFTLENFSIDSVTGGADAQGEVNVKIKSHNKVYNGQGISVDIVEAGILAYIAAINNMLYDAEEQK